MAHNSLRDLIELLEDKGKLLRIPAPITLETELMPLARLKGCSALLIDATLKWPYPPTSLPKKEYMERALQLWNELGLGPLNLKSPWFGYNLGYWTKDDEENAELIVKGDYRAVGRKLLEKA